MSQVDGSQAVNSRPLIDFSLTDPAVLVLNERPGKTGADNDERGKLFERFFARLLQTVGYSDPVLERIGVTRSGIEIDITAVHRFTKQPVIVECKAQTTPVSPTQLGKFHSKLIVERYQKKATHGLFVALPRFTGPAYEQAMLISEYDKGFTFMTSIELVAELRKNGMIVDCPLQDILTSDPAVLITQSGVYGACLENDDDTRTARRALVWSKPSKRVPQNLLDVLAGHPYSQNMPAVDARFASDGHSNAPIDHDTESVIVTVKGSDSDFEYQPPASPRYFVGREVLVEEVGQFLDSGTSVLVLNAKSGMGKSSLALKLAQLAQDKGGYALVVDSRTARNRRFVTEVLREASKEASRRGVIRLPANASWASLASALQSLNSSEWLQEVPLLVFFDQFENVFRDELLTREFRDLALGAKELLGRLSVGFAWKTDDVGWIDGFPFHLRNEIKTSGTAVDLDPLKAQEVSALLRRLERTLERPLTGELGQRLREFSQGLPWMFKKLAAHILREIRSGATQERLASEELNIRNLFDSDMGMISGKEKEALKYIAQRAPIAITEAAENIDGAVIRSLIHSRLVVEVGADLDIYWDIFRDYLNTGQIPIQDSYIIRLSPISIARLLREVVRDEGVSDIREVARRLNTSENAVFNLSRELRLLGVTVYEPSRVRMAEEIWKSHDRESELRRHITVALRRHRAFSTFSAMIGRQGAVTLDNFAHELPSAFPAVEAKESTWKTYARSFLLWFEYSGLAMRSDQVWVGAPDGLTGRGQLLGVKLARRMRSGFLHERPGPIWNVICAIAANPDSVSAAKYDTRTIRSLVVLGALAQDTNGRLAIRRSDLFSNGCPVPEVLYELMSAVPGVAAGLALLRMEPGAAPEAVGEVIRRSLGADWKRPTAMSVGKNMRAWARTAGLPVRRVPRTREAN